MLALRHDRPRRMPDRPCLLLVHGMFASRRMWDLNLAALGDAFDLVRVELPGHGDSPPLRNDAEAAPAAFIAAFERLREELGIARWFLCGQSFGAGLTLNYAQAHPERVIAQAFTNSRTVFRDAASEREAALRHERMARIRAGGRAAMRDEVFHPVHARRFPPDIKATLVEDADRVDIESYLRLFAITSPAVSFHGRDAQPQVPTLLINGRHERVFQPCRDALAAAWPTLEICDLDGGHAVNVENPEGFAQALNGFLQRHLPAAPAAPHPNK